MPAATCPACTLRTRSVLTRLTIWLHSVQSTTSRQVGLVCGIARNDVAEWPLSMPKGSCRCNVAPSPSTLGIVLTLLVSEMTGLRAERKANAC